MIRPKTPSPALQSLFITSLSFHQHRNLWEVDIFLCLFLVHLQLTVPCDVSALPHKTSIFLVCNHIASAQYVLWLNVDIDLNVLKW